MKRMLSLLLVLVAAALSAGTACAAASPVKATHTITSYEKDARVATIGCTIHVTNRSNKALSNLTLRIIPSPPFRGKPTTLTIGQLAPNGSADVAFRFEAPPAVPEKILSRQPLFLAGKCLDSDGALLEFPAESRPGGAK